MKNKRAKISVWIIVIIILIIIWLALGFFYHLGAGLCLQNSGEGCHTNSIIQDLLTGPIPMIKNWMNVP